MSELKFKQIVAGTNGKEYVNKHTLYGLTDSGEVFELRTGRLVKEDENGHAKSAGPEFSWWHPIPMSTEKMPEYESVDTPPNLMPE